MFSGSSFLVFMRTPDKTSDPRVSKAMDNWKGTTAVANLPEPLDASHLLFVDF
jgi:hypothetical protein